MQAEFSSLYDLFAAIPDEKAAIAYFRAIRWKNGEFCPYCGHDKLYEFANGKTWKCARVECHQRFSIRVGTIFEDSKIPLRKWLAAIWLITSHRKGIASTQLARDIDVTQKTGWFMLHRLRHAARTRSFNRPLKGIIESDTTFIGGKEKNKHAHKKVPGSQGGRNKDVVLGLIEREGELRAFHVPDTKAQTIQGEVRRHVAKGSTVMTDDDGSFVGLDRDYHHLRVRHGRGEYVRHGTIHNNRMEGMWALLKRQIYGIHHWVSGKHLTKYIDEATWRYNRRELKDRSRIADFLSAIDGRLTYATLTQKA
jgi:transposase-like protein